MANKVLQSRIKIKTDLKENWESNGSFVPMLGEICFYSNINKVKIGDGTTDITNLPFLEVENSNISNISLSLNDLSVGTEDTPVYFEDGIPKSCTVLSIDTNGNAATASVANKTAGVLTVKDNGTTIAMFDGSEDAEINFPGAAHATTVNLIRW